MTDDLQTPGSAAARYLETYAWLRRQPGAEKLPTSDCERGLLAAADAMDAKEARELTSHDFLVEIEPTKVRPISMSFRTTPLTDSDPNLGPTATSRLVISVKRGNIFGGYRCHIVGGDSDKTVSGGTDRVTVKFEAEGDWEASGLLEALVELGERLKPLAAARRRQRP